MKKILGFLFVLTFITLSFAYAKAERIQIQNPAQKQKKEDAKTLAKTVDLSKISDPQTRNALQAVFANLDLKDKTK